MGKTKKVHQNSSTKIKGTVIWQNTDASLSMPNKLYKEIEHVSKKYLKTFYHTVEGHFLFYKLIN